jgi:hypothetical protein
MATQTYETNAVGNAIALSAAVVGNGDSTNIADRGIARIGLPGALVVVSAIGATPTVTLNIQGSVDGVNWFNVPYALVATPETLTVAAIVITTAVTTTYLLRPNHAWRFLKTVRSANTNVTLTETAFV